MGTLGVEWVRKYNGLAGDLTNTQAQAEGFYNTLSGVRSFNWGDDLAWDQDFEQLGSGTPSSGTDTTWADNVDAVFFSGHGSQGAFHFGRRIDDAAAKNTEVVLGDWDLEFAALDACLVLEESGVFGRWGWPVFKGLHVLCGFHTVTGDEPHRGRIFAQYLNAGRTVREAWIRAAQDTEGSGTQWAYLRADGAGGSTYTDHWWGQGPIAPDPTSPTTLFYARGAC